MGCFLRFGGVFMANYLITGGAGFIGGNFCHYMVNTYPQHKFICVDALTYAGNIETLLPLMNKPNFKFIQENICNKEAIFKLFEKEDVSYVINFAAETHVDNSIKDPEVFIKTNILGTHVLLEACKRFKVKRFHQVSTDEVYGDLPLEQDNLAFTEESSISPSSPYSASKASADLLVMAYFRTYQLPCTISRCSNNYGPYQHPEKLIPLMIRKAIQKEFLPIYGNGKNVRDWLHVYDHCRAIDLIIKNGRIGQIYNVGGYNEKSNIEIVKIILKELGCSEDLITFVEDRPGHDLRYAVNSTKLRKELGWKPIYNFDIEIKHTIQWYLKNQNWVNSF